jgi:hypothetical protein
MKQFVSQRTDSCNVLYWEIVLHFCRENSNSVNIGNLTCDLVSYRLYRSCILYRSVEIYQHVLLKTTLSQSKGVYCVGWEQSDCRPCARGRPCISLCFICTSSLQATIVSSSHRHDEKVNRALTSNATLRFICAAPQPQRLKPTVQAMM